MRRSPQRVSIAELSRLLRQTKEELRDLRATATTTDDALAIIALCAVYADLVMDLVDSTAEEVPIADM
jgi:hypothetical protein